MTHPQFQTQPLQFNPPQPQLDGPPAPAPKLDAKGKPIPVVNSIADITWSHSALETASQCLFKYHAVRVLKSVPYVQNEYGKRGDLVHVAVEEWFLGRGKFAAAFSALDEKDQKRFLELKPYFERVKSFGLTGDSMEVEQQIVFDNQGNRVGWWDGNVWVRAKIDWFARFNGGKDGHALDWKTGKVRDVTAQAKRYAWLLFQAYPEMENVSVQFAYWDHNQVLPAFTWTRADAPELLSDTVSILTEIATAHKTGVWPQTTSGLCHGYCEVTNCTHWKPRKAK